MSTAFTGHACVESMPVTPPVSLRHDWTLGEAKALYELPLLELLFRAQSAHRAVWKENRVQLCSLLSIKTGGCPEDCGYCPQSARHETGVKAEALLPVGISEKQQIRGED